jgi:hypothetical protein
MLEIFYFDNNEVVWGLGDLNYNLGNSNEYWFSSPISPTQV